MLWYIRTCTYKYAVWIMIVCVSYSLATTDVKFEAYTKTQPDLYLHDNLGLRCTASSFDDVEVISISYYDNDKTLQTACAKVGVNWAKLDHLGPVNCTEAVNRGSQTRQFNINFSMPITRNIVQGGQFYCTVKLSTQQQLTSNNNFTVPVIKEAPKNLILHTSSDPLVESKEFNFNCTSELAVPKSQYKYEVSRGDTVVSTNNIYIPTVEDRGGLTLKCTDTVHSRLTTTSDITRSKHLRPHYLVVDGDTEYSLNLTSTQKHKFRCSVSGYPSDMSYEWTRDGELEAVSESVYELFDNTSASGTEVNIVCTAKGSTKVPSVSISWAIVLFNESVTKENGASTAEPKTAGNMGPKLIGGVVGALLALAALVLIIIAICKRRKTKSSKVETPIEEDSVALN